MEQLLRYSHFIMGLEKTALFQMNELTNDKWL